MEIVLTVTDGPHLGREFVFSEHDTFLVGRSKRAHFQLVAKDMYFSRMHFLVEVNPPRVRVIDMKSRNGTWVNGQRVPSADLRDGDKIKAGHTILRVALRYAPGEKPEEAATAAPGTMPAAPATAATQAAMPVIPGYRLERELGRGGMGVVYLGREEASGETVALKTITPAVTPTGSQVERFLREARILEQLRHPNIVAFRAMGESGGLLWFAMEYVPGADAARLLKNQGPLPVKLAVRIVCQMLQALEHAHGKGFVHRDIKPANILLESRQGDRETRRHGDRETRRHGDRETRRHGDTETGRQGDKETGGGVKLADFGLARVYQTSQISGLTLAGDIGGTAKFMPPEQITNYREVKPPADQYAAAATLYNLLTGAGVYDFKGGGIEAIAMILDEEPVPIRERRAELPEKLAAVIHQALARDPSDRFADVAAFRKALTPFGK